MIQIQRPPAVKDLAYDALRERITRGDFAPDQRLTEVALALQLGVSRTPVREAMARLASEGYLAATDAGYRVPEISAADIGNMSEVRVLLEPQAARQAAANPDAAGIAAMGAAIEAEQRAHQADDADGFERANQAYRAAWLKRAHNPLLLEALAKAMRTLQLIRQRTASDAVLRQYMLESHRGLLDAIERRDADAAAAWQAERVRGFNALVLERLFGHTP